jgi:malate dehydrogenase
MKRVGIIGGGNVGTNTAFFLAENGIASATLVDIKPGVPQGKSLDLMEAGPLRGYKTSVVGSNDIESIRGCDVVVIAAGRVRKPGERRVDLFRDNSRPLGAMCAAIRRLTPDAVVVNLVEPVDWLTLLVHETLGFERTRVLGVGGLLTATRLRHMVSDALKVSPREVTALVVGPHRSNMVILRDTVRVSGIPAAKLLGEPALDAIIDQVRSAGDTILQMAQWSTAYYAPSAAACGLIEAIVDDTHAILPVSVRLDGEYGIDGLCVGVPAQIGAKGVEKILEVRLNAGEQAAFQAACAELRSNVEGAAASH